MKNAILMTLIVTSFSGFAAAESLVPGSTEAVAFVGGSDGHGTIGAGLAKAINTRWLAIGELAYVNSRAVEFGGNAHYLFPIKNPKFTPYALVGLGVFHSSAGRGSTSFGANIGGGARWQTGDNWGVRPELKIFVGDGSYARFTIGLYYKFGR